MMRKKGSHVGIVLSFVVFVTFLVFLYSTLQPVLKVDESKKVLLENLKVSLVQNFSTELTKVIFKNEDGNCITLAKTDLDIGSEDCGYVAKAGDNLVGISVNEDITMIGVKELYYSTALETLQTSVNCEEGLTNTPIGSVSTKEYVFYSLINKTNSSLGTDGYYETLKKDTLKIIEGDFDFVFTPDDGEVIRYEQKPPESVNIYTDEILLSYIDDKANIKYGVLFIRVW